MKNHSPKSSSLYALQNTKEVIQKIKIYLLKNKLLETEPQNQAFSEIRLQKDLHNQIRAEANLPPSDLAFDKKSELVKIGHVREAIDYFENEQVFLVKPHVGTMVKEYTDEELLDIWTARVSLESFALIEIATKNYRDIKEAEEWNAVLMKIVATRSKEVATLPTESNWENSGNLAYCDRDEIPTDQEILDFVIADHAFHTTLTKAAGFAHLAEEIDILQLKLRLASTANRHKDKRRMIQIVQEHKNILNAINSTKTQTRITNPEENQKQNTNSPSKQNRITAADFPGPYSGALLSADVNAVKYAFMLHMKNSGIEGLQIKDLLYKGLKSNADALKEFELPEIPFQPDVKASQEALKHKVSYLLQLRYQFESYSVWQLAMRKNVNLEMAYYAIDRMNEIAKRMDNENRDPYKKIEFLNRDMAFHISLTFLAGILFGEEVINYLWHEMFNYQEIHSYLNRDKARRIIQQHEAILDAIRDANGDPAKAKEAVNRMRAHLNSSLLDNFEDPKLLQEIAKLINSDTTSFMDAIAANPNPDKK
jgi:DNA-binding GntR family transcriptional regulator